MTSRKNTTEIFKIQKNCAKFIIKNHKSTGIELFWKGGIIPFPLLISHELLKLGYKISNKMLSELLLELYNKNNGKKGINMKQ